MLSVGIMSGTSLDGIDVALCEILGSGTDTSVRLIEFDTYDLPQAIQEKVRQCAANEFIRPATMSSLNFKLGELFADGVKQICQKSGIETTELDFVASHGQTIYHHPFPNNEYVANTMQLGESGVIAARCGCTVISDFRVIDVALGGQGAPLVPYSEYVVYADKNKSRGLQNLGGIGNITIVPNTMDSNDIVAFDTGPANMMIDSAMKHYFQKNYDKGGESALSGEFIPQLQAELKGHPYLKLPIPKSTGREMFGDDYVASILERYKSSKAEDVVATLTWFTAYCISYHYYEYVEKIHTLDELIISGGGSHNKAIRKYLSELMPEVSILVQEDIGFNSDAKEAIAFVILANETLHKQPSNVPSATGASKPAILGKIQYAP